MTRTQIIAQLDAEISRLGRARDFLAAALKNSKVISAKSILSATRVASTTRAVPAEKPARLKKAVLTAAPVAAAPAKEKPKPSTVAKKRSQPALPAVASPEPVGHKEVASPAPLATQPQIQRVPPKRRVERRQSQSEKAPSAALGGFVPAGPVAVSANEARKQQERNTLPPSTPTPAVDLRTDANAERSLGSLIQAFERRAGVNRAEIP